MRRERRTQNAGLRTQGSRLLQTTRRLGAASPSINPTHRRASVHASRFCRCRLASAPSTLPSFHYSTIPFFHASPRPSSARPPRCTPCLTLRRGWDSFPARLHDIGRAELAWISGPLEVLVLDPHFRPAEGRRAADHGHPDDVAVLVLEHHRDALPLQDGLDPVAVGQVGSGEDKFHGVGCLCVR